MKSLADTFKIDFDPASPDSFIFISEQIYDGLVRIDKNLNIIPSLAEYWKISPDGKRHTFFLTQGIQFHDGGELTADDVKFSFERLLDKSTDSPYHQFFLLKVKGADDFRDGIAEEVEGFKVIDKYTFEIHWTKPFVSALYLLSMHFCKILPSEQVLDRGKNFFMKPSGTGPFIFDHWLRDTRLNVVGVRLKRNSQYFKGMPFLEALEFCPHFTLDNFLKEEIDSMPVLSDRLLRSNYPIFNDGSLHTIFLGMSCHMAPLDNVYFRNAIAFGIDKKEIVRVVDDMRFVRKETNNFIPSKLPGFFPNDRVMYDLEKAKRFIQDAGFSEETKIPSLTFLVDLPRREFKIKIYRELKKQLSLLGIDLKMDYYRSLEELKSFDKPYLMVSERLMSFPDSEDIIRPLFFSKSVFNVFSYKNNELDSLLKQAEIEHSWTMRINHFRRIEEILVSDVPAVPLFTQENKVAMQPYVKGVTVPPLGLFFLEARKIWLDK